MPATKTRDTRRKVVPTEGEVQELFQRLGICVDGTSSSSVETRGSHELSDHKPDSAYDYVRENFTDPDQKNLMLLFMHEKKQAGCD